MNEGNCLSKRKKKENVTNQFTKRELKENLSNYFRKRVSSERKCQTISEREIRT